MRVLLSKYKKIIEININDVQKILSQLNMDSAEMLRPYKKTLNENKKKTSLRGVAI